MNIVSVQFSDNRVLPWYTEWTISQVCSGTALFLAVGGVGQLSSLLFVFESDYSDYLYLLFRYFKMNRWICEQAIWDSLGFSKTILAFCLNFLFKGFFFFFFFEGWRERDGETSCPCFRSQLIWRFSHFHPAASSTCQQSLRWLKQRPGLHFIIRW